MYFSCSSYNDINSLSLLIPMRCKNSKELDNTSSSGSVNLLHLNTLRISSSRAKTFESDSIKYFRESRSNDTPSG
jgi:hypothetical protein